MVLLLQVVLVVLVDEVHQLLVKVNLLHLVSTLFGLIEEFPLDISLNCIFIEAHILV